MGDIIKLLPDSVANQIAAGEVIQRPASAVKELLENAVDAGADKIDLIIKDAGKTLIQVTDNGSGMSETDARMSFERHATSKINTPDDLFMIRTLGFRGEALASIAAISHVQIKTRLADEDLGTLIEIQGGEVTRQEPAGCPAGTTISVKNLFFNVPARRKFLKSDSAELRHIMEEFHRVAYVYPEIGMSLQSNGRYLHQLPGSVLKQRIVNILGASYSKKIIPVEEKTDKVSISGFIGKPEFAKKTRGEQYFFANKRYIRHPYLHHAVDNAFEELLPSDSFPTYYIFIETDPQFIDVNIHPTKTEVNFQDNQLIYAILRSAIRRSLSQFNVAPSLDFDAEQSFSIQPDRDEPIRNPFHRKDSGYNPFENKSPEGKRISPTEKQSNRATWEKLYEVAKNIESTPEKTQTDDQEVEQENNEPVFAPKFIQVQNKYILTAIKSGVMIIDQHNAHFRILYEKFLDSIEKKRTATQHELFPRNLSFSHEDAEILREIKGELEFAGFSIKEFGKNSFVVDGTPGDTHNHDLLELLEGIIENYKKELRDVHVDKKIGVARASAARMAVRQGKKLQTEEMEVLIDQLFRCKIPEKTPDGRKTLYLLPFGDIEKKFNERKTS